MYLKQEIIFIIYIKQEKCIVSLFLKVYEKRKLTIAITEVECVAKIIPISRLFSPHPRDASETRNENFELF